MHYSHNSFCVDFRLGRICGSLIDYSDDKNSGGGFRCHNFKVSQRWLSKIEQATARQLAFQWPK